MTMSILQTKLYVPPPRADAIPRPRLLQRLDEGLRLQRPLTLVTATAGSGKTTLVSDWIAGGDRPAAWLSLDVADDDPTRFLTYVVAALQTLDAGFGLELMALLDASQPPAVAGFMPNLINEILTQLPAFILVLDDYHLITDRSIHDAVALLIDHAPPNMHLVLMTRADPPLPLARLRVRDGMTEVRAADLRFTADEAALFLNERMGLNLRVDDVKALAARTEGWIAGLQLAALSLREENDVAGFIDSFTGSDRYVLDYLVEEVLARQPADVQDFLLRTSILDRLSSALCDAVTGRSDSRHILARLEAANLFVIALDNRRTWYRYHQLFADLLRFRLQAEQPDEIKDLHLRACAWYEAHEFAAESIQHALSAEAWDRAADLLEQAVLQLGKREGSILFLLDLCEQLPERVLARRPLVTLYYAWLLADTAQVAEAERRLQQLEASGGEAIKRFAGTAAAIRSQMAVSQGQAAEAVAQAQRALTQLPAHEESLWRDLAVLSLIFGAYLLLGDLALAEDALDQLPPFGQHPTAVQLLAHGLVGSILLARGKYHVAAERLERTLQHAVLDERSGRLHPMAGLAQIVLGQIYLAWNRVDEAAPLIESGLRLGTQTQNVVTQAQGYRILLELRLAQGDEDGLREALDSVRTLEQALRTAGVWLADAVAAYRERIEATIGRVAALRAWLSRYRNQRSPFVKDSAKESDSPSDSSSDSPSDAALPYGVLLQEVTFARVLLAVGSDSGDRPMLEEASSVLSRLIAAATIQELHNIELRSWLYSALVQQALGEDETGVAALAQAIALAAPAGIVRHFLDEGEPVRRLLQMLVRRADAPVYAAVLLDAFGEPAVSETPEVSESSAGLPPVRQANQQLVEPLTDRELDVLQLMAEGCTNKEIAEQLTVTEGTVKSHAKRIYGKLAVGNRTEAAAQARTLGLVS